MFIIDPYLALATHFLIFPFLFLSTLAATHAVLLTRLAGLFFFYSTDLIEPFSCLAFFALPAISVS